MSKRLSSMSKLGPTLPPSIRTRSPSRAPRLLVRFHPAGYRLAKLVLIVLRLICIAFFAFAAWLYHTVPLTYFSYSLTAYGLVLDIKYFPLLRTLHMLCGVGFALPLLLPLFRWSSRLLSSPQRRVAPHNGNRVVVIGRGIKSTIKSAYNRLYGRQGLFGIESPYFELIFLIREIVELTLQSIQAAQMSRLLSRPWFTRFFVAILVSNCWLTPLLHYVFRRREALQRLSSVFCDISLDFVSVVFTPVYLFYFYYREFDTTTMDFPFSLWYDDRWLINFLHESQLMFLSSWGDVFSRIFFSVSLLGGINSVERLIAPHKRAVASSARSNTSASREVDIYQSHPHISRVSRLDNCVLHPLMALWGLAVLTIHLHASRLASPPSCDVVVYPWFVSKPACSLMIINCHSRSILGRSSELDGILGEVEEKALAHIVFRHCSRLEMPTIISRFPAMVGLKMYNASIIEWSQTAALTASNHPAIRFMYLVRVDFQEGVLPDGMKDAQFPQTLVDIQLCVTNIHQLPDDLHSRWPSGGMIGIEISRLDYIPPTLLKMPLFVLSLAGNNITLIPPTVFEDSTTFIVLFSNNPISTLPESVTYPSERYLMMYLDLTSLNSIPHWIEEPLLKRVLFMQAGQTPFCDALLLSNMTHEEQPWLDLIMCNVHFDKVNVSLYPLEDEVIRSVFLPQN